MKIVVNGDNKIMKSHNKFEVGDSINFYLNHKQ